MKDLTAFPLLAAGTAKGFFEAACDNPNTMLLTLAGILGGRKAMAGALLLHVALLQGDAWMKVYDRNTRKTYDLMSKVYTPPQEKTTS